MVWEYHISRPAERRFQVWRTGEDIQPPPPPQRSWFPVRLWIDNIKAQAILGRPGTGEGGGGAKCVPLMYFYTFWQIALKCGHEPW